MRDTVEEFGRLDILVNNAAFQEHVETLEDLTEEHFDRTIKTNLYGYFHMAKAAVPHMKPGSAIIKTGSVTGIEGSKKLLDYSMTKGGIHAFTRSLAANLIAERHPGERVAPGPVWTPLNPADKRAEEVAKFGSDTPMKRAGAAGGDRAGLRVPRRAELLQLHHRRDPADHRRLFGRVRGRMSEQSRKAAEDQEPRKGMPSPRLMRPSSGDAFEPIPGPGFDAPCVELDKIADVAWDGYQDRKARARARPGRSSPTRL